MISLILKTLYRIPIVNRKVYDASLRYIDLYRGFSYDFKRNGELLLLKTCRKLFSGSHPVIFDVGANVGNWTIHAQEVIPGGVFHLFEMTDSTFEELSGHLGDSDNIYLNRIALTNRSGRVQFRDYDQSGNRNTTVIHSNYLIRESKTKWADSLTGDDYCRSQSISSIDLLKIDVEGAEMKVLIGFKRLLSDKKIKIIQFEYGYVNADSGNVMRDFYNFLESCGYVLGPLRKSGVKFKDFSYDDNDFKSGPNYVACLPQFVDLLSSFRD